MRGLFGFLGLSILIGFELVIDSILDLVWLSIGGSIGSPGEQWISTSELFILGGPVQGSHVLKN